MEDPDPVDPRTPEDRREAYGILERVVWLLVLMAVAVGAVLWAIFGP